MFAFSAQLGEIVNPLVRGPRLPERCHRRSPCQIVRMASTERPRRPAHPWATATAALTATHHGFELATGVGLVLQPELGLAGSGAFWGLQLPVWLVLASRRGGRGDPLLAAWSGAALAGAVVHFVLWPVRRNRFGIPVLAEAEGLDGVGLSAYNTILYAWGATAALSILVDIPRGRRRWALVGLATLPLQRFSAARHFTWLAGQAAEAPAWWNRAVRSA